jgi:type IV secretion system protein VirB9
MFCSKINKRCIGALVVLLVASPVLALQSPRPIATDSRIRTVRYSGNEVYQFIGHYGFQSAIEFEADEKIQTVSVGDSVAWLINPSGNRLFLKPIEQNALTNMTVITDKRSYLFELHAEETKDIRDKNMVFSYRFIYPQSDASAVDYSQFEPFPDIDKNPEKFNFNYSIRGSTVIEPIRIFDDGEFTYFEFKDKNAEIPAFFRMGWPATCAVFSMDWIKCDHESVPLRRASIFSCSVRRLSEMPPARITARLLGASGSRTVIAS